MILILLMLGLLGFIVGFLALKHRAQRWIVGGASLLILVMAASLMIGNDTQHWGMQPVTKTTTTPLQSAVKNDYISLLLYQPIKHATTEKVYVYRPVNQTKRQHTAANLTTHVTVQTSKTNTAVLTTKTTRWAYRNAAWRWLFSATGNHTTLIKRRQIFSLPNHWATLSVSQAQWLAKQAKALKATEQTTMATKVKQLRSADPSLSATQAKAQVERQLNQQTPSVLAKLIKQAQQQSKY